MASTLMKRGKGSRSEHAKQLLVRTGYGLPIGFGPHEISESQALGTDMTVSEELAPCLRTNN
jgi:hypothetical protein